MIANKKIWITACTIFGWFLMLVLVQLVLSYKAVKNFQKGYGLNPRSQTSLGWFNPEVNFIKKDILWYEQLLMLSKSDSIYLAINLRDSIVQLKLKGIYLAEAKIIFQYPYNFLGNANEDIYKHFAKVSSILNETANFSKKPVQKIIANSNENKPVEVRKNIVAEKPLHWTFLTRDNLRVVISGVQADCDSSLIFHPEQYVWRNRIKAFIREPFPGKFTPTLYIWLCDKEATAIFRAVPPGGKLLFRN